MTDPLPVAVAAGGGVFLVAQGSIVTQDSTPLAILAGVLGSVVALLGWVVRRQQTQAEAQATADRTEREEDRSHDREERRGMLKAWRDEIQAERSLTRETTQESTNAVRVLVDEIRALRADQNAGMACRWGEPSRGEPGSRENPIEARPASKPNGTRSGGGFIAPV